MKSGSGLLGDGAVGADETAKERDGESTRTQKEQFQCWAVRNALVDVLTLPVGKSITVSPIRRLAVSWVYTVGVPTAKAVPMATVLRNCEPGDCRSMDLS
jgi:hypothetical protein